MTLPVPDLVVCEHQHYFHGSTWQLLMGPTTPDQCLKPGCDSVKLTFYWDNLSNHYFYAIRKAFEGVRRSLSLPEAEQKEPSHDSGLVYDHPALYEVCEACNLNRHSCPGCGDEGHYQSGVCPDCEEEYALLDSASSSVHDDRMIASSTDNQSSGGPPTPQLTQHARLSEPDRLYVTTDPDFVEYVEGLAEKVRVLLYEDEGTADRLTDLVVDLFDVDPCESPDNPALLEQLQTALQLTVLEELAPLLVRICSTGDWKDPC